jgi:hypothetical protein
MKSVAETKPRRVVKRVASRIVFMLSFRLKRMKVKRGGGRREGGKERG